jgi:hypothetical protein
MIALDYDQIEIKPDPLHRNTNHLNPRASRPNLKQMGNLETMLVGVLLKGVWICTAIDDGRFPGLLAPENILIHGKWANRLRTNVSVTEMMYDIVKAMKL